MAIGKIKTNTEAVETWCKGAGLNLKELAVRMEMDPGNFNKMFNGELEPSKTFMKALIDVTGYPMSALFEYEQNASI